MKKKSFDKSENIEEINSKSVLSGFMNKEYVLPKLSQIGEYFLFLRGANLSIHLDNSSNISQFNKSLSRITECKMLLKHKFNKSLSTESLFVFNPE